MRTPVNEQQEQQQQQLRQPRMLKDAKGCCYVLFFSIKVDMCLLALSQKKNLLPCDKSSWKLRIWAQRQGKLISEKSVFFFLREVGCKSSVAARLTGLPGTCILQIGEHRYATMSALFLIDSWPDLKFGAGDINQFDALLHVLIEKFPQTRQLLNSFQLRRSYLGFLRGK